MKPTPSRFCDEDKRKAEGKATRWKTPATCKARWVPRWTVESGGIVEPARRGPKAKCGARIPPLPPGHVPGAPYRREHPARPRPSEDVGSESPAPPTEAG
jgi:hypothetical protein